MKSWRYAPVMMIAALIFEYTVLRAAFITLRQGGIRWRDTFYPLDVLRTCRLRGERASAGARERAKRKTVIP
jgi:hypothetical protein